MTSSISLLPCLQILEQNDLKLDNEAIEKILKELLVELDKSQVKQYYKNFTKFYFLHLGGIGIDKETKFTEN